MYEFDFDPKDAVAMSIFHGNGLNRENPYIPMQIRHTIDTVFIQWVNPTGRPNAAMQKFFPPFIEPVNLGHTVVPRSGINLDALRNTQASVDTILARATSHDVPVLILHPEHIPQEACAPGQSLESRHFAYDKLAGGTSVLSDSGKVAYQFPVRENLRAFVEHVAVNFFTKNREFGYVPTVHQGLELIAMHTLPFLRPDARSHVLEGCRQWREDWLTSRWGEFWEA